MKEANRVDSSFEKMVVHWYQKLERSTLCLLDNVINIFILRSAFQECWRDWCKKNDLEILEMHNTTYGHQNKGDRR